MKGLVGVDLEVVEVEEYVVVLVVGLMVGSEVVLVVGLMVELEVHEEWKELGDDGGPGDGASGVFKLQEF